MKRPPGARYVPCCLYRVVVFAVCRLPWYLLAVSDRGNRGGTAAAAGTSANEDKYEHILV